MSVSVVEFPFDLYTDTAGKPLDAGFIYVGVANADPVVSPVAVFWDAALTIPAAQPLRTTGGYISRNGAPANFFCASDYSIRICDKTNTQIFYVAQKVDVGVTDVVIANGESLIVESGGTIDVLDGGVVNIGDGTGVGAKIEFAENARIVGEPVPDTDGSQQLGLITRRWFLNASGVRVEGDVLPQTAGGMNIGTDTFPAEEMVSRAVRADSLTTYRTAQPSSASDYAGLAKLNSRTMILACGKQTSTTATAALEPNEAYNISGIVYNAGPLTYTITFTVPVPDNAHIWVQQAYPPTAGTSSVPLARIDPGGSTATVSVGGSSATVAIFHVFVMGSPSATGASGIVSPIL